LSKAVEIVEVRTKQLDQEMKNWIQDHPSVVVEQLLYTELRRRVKHIIVPAARECAYKAVRADEISEPGIITS
jgi:hypothetical protein